MDIIHFIKHSFGLCGCCPKTFITMLLGGTGLIGISKYYWKNLKDKGIKCLRNLKVIK